VWPQIWSIAVDAWNRIYTTAEMVVTYLVQLWQDAAPKVLEIFNNIKEWWDENGEHIKQTIYDLWVKIRDDVVPTIQNMWDSVVAKFNTAWGIIQYVMAGIKIVIDNVLAAIIWVWDNWGEEIKTIFSATWDKLISTLSGAWDIMVGIFNFFLDLFQGDWEGAWENFKRILSGAWEIIRSTIEWGATVITAILGKAWDWMGDRLEQAWQWFLEVIKLKLAEIKTWVENKFQEVMNFFTGIPDRLKQIGKDILQGLWNGLKEKWEELKRWFEGITNMIPDLKGPMSKDRQLLVASGEAIMQGFNEGLVAGWTETQDLLDNMTSNLDGAFVGDASNALVGSAYHGPSAAGNTAYVQAGAIQINIDGAKDNVEEEVRRGIEAALAGISANIDGTDN
jgi:phage-related protein